MPSIDSIKASSGSGNASVATVQTTRSAGATTLIVDTVQGINTNFHGTMGTPHTFTDPITGETITVISEATAVDFKGHVDGSNLEIDTIAPGYTDAGSAVGDIIIIKPTTQEQDELADILEVAHNDDGTVKNEAISLETMFTDDLNPVIRGEETFANFVLSGGAVAQDSGLIGTFSDIVFYIDGERHVVAGVANKTYTASKDTYVDMGIDETVDYNEVANGAAAPALEANHIRLAKVVTNGSAITGVTQTGMDSLGNSIYQVESKVVTKIFTTAGANTWTKPENLRYAIVEVQGGGGGGGGTSATSASQNSMGAGGGGGGYARSKVNAIALGATETVTVGAAGTTGSGAFGGTGGASSFGAHAAANGGSGGSSVLGANTAGFGATGAFGGSGTVGDLLITGKGGFWCSSWVTHNNVCVGGMGGHSMFGTGGHAGLANSSGGAATGYGGGGGGGARAGSQGATTGGAATAGIVIVREYF